MFEAPNPNESAPEGQWVKGPEGEVLETDLSAPAPAPTFKQEMARNIQASMTPEDIERLHAMNEHPELDPAVQPEKPETVN